MQFLSPKRWNCIKLLQHSVLILTIATKSFILNHRILIKPKAVVEHDKVENECRLAEQLVSAAFPRAIVHPIFSPRAEILRYYV